MKTEAAVERVAVSEILPPIEDDVEPLPAMAVPDHFYPTGKPDFKPSSPVPLDPECDPTASRGIPVFKPTWAEFQDFYTYIKSIDEWGLKSGIVKIIPPPEWKDSLPPTNDLLPGVKIKQPITQHFMGRSGCYRQTNIVKRKNMSYKNWIDFAGPGGSWEAPNLRKIQMMEMLQEEEGQRRTRSGGIMRSMNSQPISSKSKAKKLQQAKSVEELDVETPETATTSTSPKKETATPISQEDADWYKSFNPSEGWLPEGMEAADYTPEACRNLERIYWSSLTAKDGETAWYGADSQGTLFTDETTSWNVGKLKSYLTELLENAGFKAKLPGVTDPYLYFGMWKATFAWHVEDMDLYSINYIHHGAPKQWYAIPQIHAQRFEHALASRFPMSMRECSEFLRHKSFVASPMTLADDGLHPNICVQHQGEFIITYPRGYHSGYNLGVNCAESVNFATKRWADLGRIAKRCHCVNDAVTINVDQLLRDAEILRMSVEERKRSNHKRPMVDDSDPIHIAKKQKYVAPIYPCLFCPVMGDEHELLPVSSEPGKKAHKLCAGFIPETYITEIDGQEHIMGLESVPKARYNLKCQLCGNPRGLKVQCTKDKCCKAFHVTCAVQENSWVHLDVLLDDGLSTSKKEPSSIDEPKAPALKDPEIIEMGPHCNPDTSNKDQTGLSPTVKPETSAEQQDGLHPAVDPVNTKTEELLVGKPNHPSSSSPQAVPRDHEDAQQLQVAADSLQEEMPVVRYESPKFETTPIDEAPVDSKEPIQHSGDIASSLIRLVVLCRQHNPAYATFKAAEKDKELFELVKKLEPGCLIKVKATGGVYQVQYLSYNEAKSSAEILWEDHRKSNIKWRSIVFNDTVEVNASKKPPESVYAGPPKTVRTAVSDVIPNGNYAMSPHPQHYLSNPQYQHTQQFSTAIPYPPNGGPALNTIPGRNTRDNYQNPLFNQFHPSHFSWNPAFTPFPPNINQMPAQSPMMWAPPPYPLYQQYRPVLAEATAAQNINYSAPRPIYRPTNPSEKQIDVNKIQQQSHNFPEKTSQTSMADTTLPVIDNLARDNVSVGPEENQPSQAKSLQI